GIERAVAQLADRGDRVRAGRVADQLIQRHQIALPAGLRHLSGICARCSHLHRPAPTVCAAAPKWWPLVTCKWPVREPLVPTGTRGLSEAFRITLFTWYNWSPVTESNRRPSPYHACRFRLTPSHQVGLPQFRGRWVSGYVALCRP